jgi:hypothetical protein
MKILHKSQTYYQGFWRVFLPLIHCKSGVPNLWISQQIFEAKLEFMMIAVKDAQRSEIILLKSHSLEIFYLKCQV